MSKQRAINSFFKPVGSKRQSEQESGDSKRFKTNSGDQVENGNDEYCSSAVKEKLISLSKDFGILDVSMGESWFLALEKEFSKPYFKKLSDFVTKERATSRVYPAQDDVWAWTKHCSLKKVKVVILGQDPYHNPGQAHGLCFSVQKGVPPPPSLVNMYKELADDIPGFKRPGHGNLTAWAQQGVLLLNACLTVRENSANSHADKGWENITDAAIKAVSERNQGVVFLLWGAFAQKKASCVDRVSFRCCTNYFQLIAWISNLSEHGEGCGSHS